MSATKSSYGDRVKRGEIEAIRVADTADGGTAVVAAARARARAGARVGAGALMKSAQEQPKTHGMAARAVAELAG